MPPDLATDGPTSIRPASAKTSAPAALHGSAAGMEFTRQFLRSKNPCANGFRWFSRNVQDGSGYQEALDTLVQAGRVEDACWLLTQFGPTQEVLTLDTLDAEAIVFAGTLQVRGSIDADAVIHTGGSIRAGGSLRAGGAITVGGDIRVEGSIRAGGALQVGGDVRAQWGIEAEGNISCAGDLRAGWDVVCGGRLQLQGGAFIGQDFIAQGGVECGKGLRVGGHLTGCEGLRAGQGILVGGTISGVVHLEAGWGIKAGESIHALGAIKAGETLSAGQEICAGAGYGVFAGLNVQETCWNTSGQVWSPACPEGLRSGLWVGPSPI